MDHNWPRMVLAVDPSTAYWLYLTTGTSGGPLGPPGPAGRHSYTAAEYNRMPTYPVPIYRPAGPQNSNHMWGHPQAFFTPSNETIPPVGTAGVPNMPNLHLGAPPSNHESHLPEILTQPPPNLRDCLPTPTTEPTPTTAPTEKI